jgi:hypothetical protein
MVRNELMWDMRNGRCSPDIVRRRKEEMGSSGQFVRWPDITSHSISSGEREGRKRSINTVVLCEWTS